MIPSGVKILLCTTPCDMRKQARGLAAMVRNEIGGDVKSGHIFAFYNRSRDILRLIFWDRSGICVLSKRLDKGRFSISVKDDGRTATLDLSGEELAELMRGRSWSKLRDRV